MLRLTQMGINPGSRGKGTPRSPSMQQRMPRTLTPPQVLVGTPALMSLKRLCVWLLMVAATAATRAATGAVMSSGIHASASQGVKAA